MRIRDGVRLTQGLEAGLDNRYQHRLARIPKAVLVGNGPSQCSAVRYAVVTARSTQVDRRGDMVWLYDTAFHLLFPHILRRYRSA